MGTSPAFSFYAKDFLTGTATFSLEEVGAYVKLLCYQWDAGSVPATPRERARILGCTAAQERAIWLRIVSKFAAVGDAYQNSRLEEERVKQAERRQKLAANGSKGGSQKVANATQALEQKPQQLGGQNPSLSSSSSFASSEKQEQERPPTPSKPLISGEASSVGWWKIHGAHVEGFCNWVCLPQFLFEEFCRKSGQGDQADGGVAYVRGWAAKVREQWSGPVGDNLKFWRDRWAESHPTKKPAEKPFSVADAIARQAGVK